MFGKKKKKSFFEKLTGSITVDDFDDDLLDGEEIYEDGIDIEEDSGEVEEKGEKTEKGLDYLDDDAGELSVDVMQTDSEIIIKAMVAGVKPGDLDIDITRDMVIITGTREDVHEISEDDYYHKELYWGSFTRNIVLPEEVDVDMAEAVEKHGLLTITLPKLDKDRKTKLQVKAR